VVEVITTAIIILALVLGWTISIERRLSKMATDICWIKKTLAMQTSKNPSTQELTAAGTPGTLNEQSE